MKIIAYIIYIFVLLILTEFGLGGIGYVYQLRSGERNVNSTYRVLTLGESTTAIGDEFSYPAQLEKILNVKGRGKISFSVINKGIIATNTSIIVANLENYIKKYDPNIIVVMMGINDNGFKESPRNHLIPRKILKSQYDVVGIIQNLHISRVMYLSYIILKQMVVVFWDTHMITDIHLLSHKLEYYSKYQTFENTEKLIQRILNLKPSDPDIYNQVADFYQLYFLKGKKWQLLEYAMSKGIINERLFNTYCTTLFTLNLHSKVLEIYKEAIAKYPKSDLVYSAAGNAEFWAGSIVKSKQLFLKALELNKLNMEAYEYLAKIVRKDHQNEEAEAILRKALALDPQNRPINSEYVSLLYELGRSQEAQVLQKEVSERYLSDITIENYIKLFQITKKHNINVFVMQYPLRNTNSFITSFITVPDFSKIATNTSFFKPPYSPAKVSGYNFVLVDNEESFKHALLTHSYDDLFTDRFAINFGHATQLGNSLIANNLANAIFDEFIDKKK